MVECVLIVEGLCSLMGLVEVAGCLLVAEEDVLMVMEWVKVLFVAACVEPVSLD